MVDTSKFVLFLTAAVLLAIAPGPGMLYVLARSLAGGRREGVLSALGTFVGGMVHVLAAAAGISVVLARSAMAFATVKYAGAAYLCFLGVRMILAALKERDIEARGKGNPNGIEEGDIQRMMQGLIKQRREAIELYKQGNRPELAQKEQAEIAVIEGFLPKQMSDADAEAAVKQVIAAVGAQSVKDMGKVMAALKEKHAGQLDLSKAGGMVKRLLS